MTRIPIFPLDLVVYPGEEVPLHIFEERYLLMIEECIHHGAPIGIALANQEEPEDALEHTPEEVGTAVRITGTEQLEDGRFFVTTEGTRRFRIRNVHTERMYQEADVEWLEDDVGVEDAAEAAAEGVRRELHRLGADIVMQGAQDPVEASYAVASALDAPLAVKQLLLNAPTAAERLLLEESILRLVPATHLN